MERLCLNCMKIYSIKSEYEKNNDQCPYCGFDDNTPPKDGMHLPPGTILNNKYIVGTVIGAGGFGATYRGWDNTLARVVAIKEYLPKGLVVRQGKELVVKSESDYEFLQKGIKRTLMEARSIVRFNDESAITNIYEFFEENGTAYIVMEYLEGCNLRDYSKNYKEILPFDMIMNLAVSICDVLDVVHKENIIHRDISPDNIFYCSKKKIYKLIDFGAVKQVDSSYMQSSTIYLKHGFAPIEQYSGSGQVGPWTDIYAFGATLYVLSTGKMPAPSVDRIGEDTLVAPQKINSSLPIEFSDAILKAMMLQPKDRFRSVKEFKHALLNCFYKNDTDNFEEQYNIKKDCKPNNIDTKLYSKTYDYSGHTVYGEKELEYGSENKKNSLIDNIDQLISAYRSDTITFGDFDSKNEWIVLDKRDRKLLVISKYAICKKAYNDDFEPVTWESSSLRKWLNEAYYNMAFSSDEQNIVASTFVFNTDNKSFDTNGGNDTTDKIFLLSIDEMNKYFAAGVEKEAFLIDGTKVWWWLRSPGGDSKNAASVDSDGTVDEIGHFIHNTYGAVRPAMWIDVSKL